jgi:hypothetical protein
MTRELTRREALGILGSVAAASVTGCNILGSGDEPEAADDDAGDDAAEAASDDTAPDEEPAPGAAPDTSDDAGDDEED